VLVGVKSGDAGGSVELLELVEGGHVLGVSNSGHGAGAAAIFECAGFDVEHTASRWVGGWSRGGVGQAYHFHAAAELVRSPDADVAAAGDAHTFCPIFLENCIDYGIYAFRLSRR
jgi:hypothetical protein